MQVREGQIASDKHPTPNERADAPEDEAELVDAEQCSSRSHALRVTQSIVPLKDTPGF